MMAIRRRRRQVAEGRNLDSVAAEEANEDGVKATWIELNFRKRECCRFVPVLAPNYMNEGLQRCGCGRLLSAHEYLNALKPSVELLPNTDSFSTVVNLFNEVKSSVKKFSNPENSRLKSTGSKLSFDALPTPKQRKSKKKHERNQSDSKWNALDHTIALPTDAYGTLEYQGSGEGDKSKYIRLAHDTHPELVLRFLTEQWKLQKPKMVITVHGGVHNFQLHPKLQRVFCDGLIKAAKTTGAWIMLFGLNTGVGSIVGNALKEHKARSRGKIHSIGVAPWGVVDNREDLIGSQTISSYQTMTNPFSKGAVLSAAHGHFLLVDNGTEGKYGIEVKFRRRLERKLSLQQIGQKHSRKVPVVCLVLEGGKNTINVVLESVRQNPPIPVIVVDGSGRAADLIAFAHQYAEDDGTMIEDLRWQFIRTIQTTFACEREQAQFIFLTIMECVKRRDLITVFRLSQVQSKHDDFDNAILTASIKAAKASAPDMLSLALTWNRVDIATSQIFVYGQQWPVLSLEQAMMDALIQDRTDFVKLLMENGVSMHKFLTIPRLEELYNIKHFPVHLLYLLEDVKKNIIQGCRFNLIEIGLVIESLMGCGYRCNYTRKRFRLYYASLDKGTMKKQGSFSKHLTANFSKIDLTSSFRDDCNVSRTNSLKLNPECNKDNSTMPAQIPKYFQYPFHELMVWAVLMKRQKMALFMWQHGEEAIAKALFAAKLYKAMAREAADDELDLEEMEELRRYSGEFAESATKLLEICYRADVDATQHLLTYQLKMWSKETCLSLAIAAQHREFIAHPCVQLLLNDLWMGGLNVRKNSSMRVILGLVFPPSIFMLQFKSLEQLQLMPQTVEEHMDDRNYSSSFSSSSSSLSSSSTSSSSSSSSSSESSASGFQHKPEVVGRGATGLDHSNQPPEDGYLVFMEQRRQLSISKKIYEFYNAPITKFWLFTLSYNAFLIFFTYVVLVSMKPLPSEIEWFVVSYVFTLTLEKIREIAASEPSGAFNKIKLWLSYFWHGIDTILILTFFLGFAFRIAQDDHLLKVGRALYCVNVSLWYIRLLNIFSVSKYLGPYVMMMGKMMVDLGTFIILIAVILISFGVTRQALLHPNEIASWSLVRDVFLEPYFMLYGEVYAGEIDPCSVENNSTLCVVGSWIVPTTMTFYLLVANILLLNMLIAVFNNTFAKVKNISDEIWKFHRYGVIVEYEFRPMFPPPFIILSYVAMLFRFCFKKRKNAIFNSDRGLKLFLDEEDVEKLHDFEEDCLDDLFRQKMLMKDEDPDPDGARQKVTSDRLERLLDYVDDSADRDDVIAIHLKVLEERLAQLEEMNVKILHTLTPVTRVSPNADNSEGSNSERYTSDDTSWIAMRQRMKFRMRRHRQDSEMSTFSDWHPSNMLLKRIKSSSGEKRQRHTSERASHADSKEFKVRKTNSTGNIALKKSEASDHLMSSETLATTSHQRGGGGSGSAIAKLLTEPEEKSVSCQDLMILKDSRRIQQEPSPTLPRADSIVSGSEFFASDIIRLNSEENIARKESAAAFQRQSKIQTMIGSAYGKMKSPSGSENYGMLRAAPHESSSGSESSCSSICDDVGGISLSLGRKKKPVDCMKMRKQHEASPAPPKLYVTSPVREINEHLQDLTPIPDESPRVTREHDRLRKGRHTYPRLKVSKQTSDESFDKRRMTAGASSSIKNSSYRGTGFSKKCESSGLSILPQSTAHANLCRQSPQSFASNQSYKSITDCIDTTKWHDVNSVPMQPPQTPLEMWWNKPPDFMSRRRSKSPSYSLERISQDEWEDEPEPVRRRRTPRGSHKRRTRRRSRLHSNSSSSVSSRRGTGSMRKHRKKGKRKPRADSVPEEEEDERQATFSNDQKQLTTLKESSSASLKQLDDGTLSTVQSPIGSSAPHFNINNSNITTLLNTKKSNDDDSFMERYGGKHYESAPCNGTNVFGESETGAKSPEDAELVPLLC